MGNTGQINVIFSIKIVCSPKIKIFLRENLNEDGRQRLECKYKI